MTKLLYPAVLSVALFIALPLVSHASQLDDGVKAYDQQDYPVAYQRLLPLAEQGAGKAQYYIGEMFVGGMGIPTNMEKGVYWLQKSVENKYHMAAKTLGKMYMSGFGVPMNPAKGAEYLVLYQSLSADDEVEPECD